MFAGVFSAGRNPESTRSLQEGPSIANCYGHWGSHVRIWLFTLITLTLTVAGAQVPTAHQILEQAERGLAHIGRGRAAAHLSVGLPAQISNGNAADYQAAARRYRELAEQARRQMAEANEARAAADQQRTEMRHSQTENQRALAEAQRKLENLSRDQSANPDEVRAARTAIETEIADRSRANNDFDQHLSRLDQNMADLQSRIEQMNAPIGAAESARAAAARSLADRGLSEDGAPLTNSAGGASPTGGDVPVAASSAPTTEGPSEGGRILVPGAADSGRTSTTGTTERFTPSESRYYPAPETQVRARAQQVQRDATPTGARANDLPSMEDITTAIKEAQAVEIKKAAAAAAALPANNQQLKNKAAVRDDSVAQTAAHQAAAGLRAPANVVRSAPGSTLASVGLQGQPLAARDFNSTLSKEQAQRITLRMAARVRDMSEPRKQLQHFEIPAMPSEQLAQPSNESSRQPASR